MTAVQQQETVSNWWSGSGWFEGSAVEGLVASTSEYSTPSGLFDDPAGPGTPAGTQQVGGAAAQNRFNGPCHIPIGTTPAKDAYLLQHNAAAGVQPIGGAVTHSRFNDRKKTGLTCDGSVAPVFVPGGMFVSKWSFNVEEWTWEMKNSAGSVHSMVAGRRWGDGRDSLGMAVQQASQPAVHEQVAKKLKLFTTGRGGGDGHGKPGNPYGFSRIGGLAKQKNMLRESVALPLKYPQLFRSMGVTPCRGVLLHGPPGSGKSVMVDALAHEAGLHLEVLNGAEICAGEAAALKIKSALESAVRNAPAILFVDELDAAAPARQDNSSESERQSTARVVCLIDDLRKGDKLVTVIGATNRRSAVDPAICRPGRLDVEIGFGGLQAQECQEVVMEAAKKLPLADDVDIKLVAQRMRGYVAADAVGVVVDAAVRAVGEAYDRFNASDMQGGEVEEALSVSVRVHQRHFDAALSAAAPAVLRDVVPDIPDVKWEDVGGLEDVKQQLKDLVEFPLKYGDRIAQYGMGVPHGALLYGPPGCGKTLLAKVVAAQCGANFISIRGPELLDKWLGESERNVRKMFESARTAAPCVIFFDEIDAIAPRRGGGGTSTSCGDAAVARVLNQLLVEMDGIGAQRDVFVLGATNRPEAIDPAILRPGRFDTIIQVPLPDQDSRLSTLRVLFRKTPLSPEVDLQALAEATDGMSGADLAEVARKAVKFAIKELIQSEESGAPSSSTHDISSTHQLTGRHIEAAMATARRSVSAQQAQRCAALQKALLTGNLEAVQAAVQVENEGDEGLQSVVRDVSQRVIASKVGKLEASLKACEGKLGSQQQYILQLELFLKEAGLQLPKNTIGANNE